MNRICHTNTVTITASVYITSSIHARSAVRGLMKNTTKNITAGDIVRISDDNGDGDADTDDG